MLPAFAFALVLAGGDPLVLAADSTDRAARDRGAYALARAYDPSDSPQATLVLRLFEAGEADQSSAVIRGLLARRERPEWFSARFERLKQQRALPPQLFLFLTPHDEAVEFLLHDAEQRQVTSSDSWIPMAWMLGDDRLTPKVEEYARLRGTDRQMFTAGPTSPGGCPLENCLDTFAMLASLHRDMSKLYDAYEGKQAFLTPENTLMLQRVKAAGGDADARKALASATRTFIDPSWRARAFQWLLTTPPAPNRDALDAAEAMLRGDPDGRNRAVAAAWLSAAAERSGGGGLEDVFVYALKDGNVDVRLEAAAGLVSLGRGEAARRAAAKTELDPAVKALLLAHLAAP